MKTPTRTDIVEIIKKNGATRPSELAGSLRISPQAVHRHLKALVSAGTLEAKGRPPSTRYVIAGTPDFSQGLAWFQASGVPNSSKNVCETRDVFSARLSRLSLLEKDGLPNTEVSLVISIIGEIGNNSFDHNLGQWTDVPGCWLETQVTHRRLWILIADRGQGIYRSLSRVDPNLANEQVAIEKAFREHISGRAPEQRGNGLKYVTNVIVDQPMAGLVCGSGKGQIDLGDFGGRCSNVFEMMTQQGNGTITVIAWELK